MYLILITTVQQYFLLLSSFYFLTEGRIDYVLLLCVGFIQLIIIISVTQFFSCYIIQS